MSLVSRLFTLVAILVAAFAVIFTVDIFKPYRQKIIDVIPDSIRNSLISISDVKRMKSGKVYTKEELSKYKGENGSPVYLAVLGHVFDVTKGKKHYGPGGGYEFFAGRDGTRGYVTGEFNDKGLIEDISGFTLSQIHSVNHWLQFYMKDYTFKGYLLGKYFDEHGNPSEAKLEFDRKLVFANKAEEEKKADIVMFPPCNSQFKSGQGKTLWCSNFSGGIQREWVGVPRQYFRPGETQARCACVKNIGPPSDQPDAKDHKNNGDLDNPGMKLYEGCDPNVDSCYFPE